MERGAWRAAVHGVAASNTATAWIPGILIKIVEWTSGESRPALKTLTWKGGFLWERKKTSLLWWDWFSSPKYTLTKWIQRKSISVSGPSGSSSQLLGKGSWGAPPKCSRSRPHSLLLHHWWKILIYPKLDSFNLAEFPSDPRLDESMVLWLLIKHQDSASPLQDSYKTHS